MASFVNLDGQPQALFPPLAEGLRYLETYSDAINEHGDVAGTSNFFGTTAGSFKKVAWVYSNGVYRFLPDLGGPMIQLRAINEAGDVTGYAETPEDDRRVGIIITANGEIVEIPGLGGSLVTGHDINNHGQVVGTATLTSELRAEFMAIFYTGAVTMPVTMPGSVGSGLDSINERGEAVGSYQLLLPNGETSVRALYYHNGRAYDLNDLVVNAPPGLRLSYGQFMQENGTIIAVSGEGNDNAVDTYLLTPVDDSTLRRGARRR